jgi:hypothetical protein
MGNTDLRQPLGAESLLVYFEALPDARDPPRRAPELAGLPSNIRHLGVRRWVGKTTRYCDATTGEGGRHRES